MIVSYLAWAGNTGKCFLSVGQKTLVTFLHLPVNYFASRKNSTSASPKVSLLLVMEQECPRTELTIGTENLSRAEKERRTLAPLLLASSTICKMSYQP